MLLLHNMQMVTIIQRQKVFAKLADISSWKLSHLKQTFILNDGIIQTTTSTEIFPQKKTFKTIVLDVDQVQKSWIDVTGWK